MQVIIIITIIITRTSLVICRVNMRVSENRGNFHIGQSNGGTVPCWKKALHHLHDNAFFSMAHLQYQTLSTEDTSDPRHFGTIRLVPKCPDSSAPVPKCIADTSALVPNCFDLQQTFFCYNSHTYERFTVILLVITIKEDNDYSHTVNDFLNYKSE